MLVFFVSCSLVLVCIALNIFRSRSQKADTTVKRIGLCLFIISATILAINILAWGTEIFYTPGYNSFRMLYRGLSPKVFYIFVFGLVLGLVMFKGLFDKLSIWIIHGSRNQKPVALSEDTRKKRRLAASHGSNLLSFKNGQAAFEYSCAYMDCKIQNGSALPALVVDSRQLFGSEQGVIVDDKGLQTCFLKVASNDAGFLVLAQTMGNGPRLKPGMFVAWQTGTYSSDVAKVNPNDQRFGWVGLIIAILNPDLDIGKGWSIHTSFNSRK